MLNKDYSDMLSLFIEKKVDFILVGAYAMAVHGYPRSTLDIDFWIKPEKGNAERVYEALQDFGAPLSGISEGDLCNEDIVFQIGVEPRRIDIITSISGLLFDEAYANCAEKEFNGFSIKVLSLSDLIKNKKTSGRLKDLADVEELERILKENEDPVN
ncbi:MAG TPA: hypothetical protein DIC34_16235 [Treponema sp.]|nr:MAG: hypothetical protein A2Y36_03135 [Treponema sp. GWA1_62_8]OHE70167.1 MAG: hypothetical protein A2001_15840 [Treponema sp. GWC1_61_84]OHE76448.1 MAG: hypothetical protein A2413_20000 [Treponema sp. RIFOXYC1_FULL_61_9]HCM28055.1 hypothetical protein [Treponema sp.]